MKQKLAILPILLLLAVFIHAQGKVADSLKQLLQTNLDDSSRVETLASIARAYLNSKPDTALALATQGLTLSKKIKFKTGELTCLNTAASVFIVKGDYPRALEFYLQALKIAEELKNEERTARIFSSLSDTYFYEGDVKRSIEYSHKAMSIQQKIKDSTRWYGSMVSLGDTYEKTDQLDSALFYTSKGYSYFEANENRAGQLPACMCNLGNIFLKMNMPDTAMALYKSAVTMLKEQNDDASICEVYLGMAKLFKQKGITDSCLYYAKLSFAISTNGGFISFAMKAADYLADYYKSVRNIDSAYFYQTATIIAKDSLFNEKKNNEIQSISYGEAMRQQQMADDVEEAKVKIKQNALLGGLAAVLLVTFFLYLNNRQKQKANKLLQKQKAEIDSKAKELSVQKENLQQSYNNVEQLGEVGRKITSSLSAEKIIGTVYDNVNALMDAEVFGIGIYNDALKRIEFPATYEEGQALPFYYNSIDDQNRLSVICFKENKEIIIGNLNEDYTPYVQAVVTPHEGKQAVSLIYLPLAMKEKRLGVLTVQSFQQNAYSEYHLFMLRNIAIYAAIALENAHSFEILRDTNTRLQSTQKLLIQSEKMASLGELTAGIAHEIQNPLNFVNNFSEVNNELIEELKAERQKAAGVRDMALENELINDIKDNSEKINHHGKRADAIVKGMLQHSRSSSGQKEPANINALADEYLRLAYHGLRAKDKSFNATLKTDYSENIGIINIVPQDIGRVVLNLITNAFYAVGEKNKQVADKISGDKYEPTVTVSTKKAGDKVQLMVMDNGGGIPKNIVDKIFQPFFTTKPTGQGTGLGLSLAYDIVKAHGGELKVETKENEGTTFIIQLPTA